MANAFPENPFFFIFFLLLIRLLGLLHVRHSALDPFLQHPGFLHVSMDRTGLAKRSNDGCDKLKQEKFADETDKKQEIIFSPPGTATFYSTVIIFAVLRSVSGTFTRTIYKSMGIQAKELLGSVSGTFTNLWIFVQTFFNERIGIRLRNFMSQAIFPFQLRVFEIIQPSRFSCSYICKTGRIFKDLMIL